MLWNKTGAAHPLFFHFVSSISRAVLAKLVMHWERALVSVVYSAFTYGELLCYLVHSCLESCGEVRSSKDTKQKPQAAKMFLVVCCLSCHPNKVGRYHLKTTRSGFRIQRTDVIAMEPLHYKLKRSSRYKTNLTHVFYWKNLQEPKDIPWIRIEPFHNWYLKCGSLNVSQVHCPLHPT